MPCALMVMTRCGQMLSLSLEGGGDGAQLKSSETRPSSSGGEGGRHRMWGAFGQDSALPLTALYEAGTHDRLVISLLG